MINLSDRNLQILHLEDCIPDHEMIRELLEDQEFKIQIDRFENKESFISAVKAKKYDLILADFNMPRYDAFRALEDAKKNCPEIPFIVVSGTIGEEKAIDLIQKGAVDYVLKDRPARLPSAIKRALSDKAEMEARKKAEEELFASREQFHLLFNSSKDAILITSEEGIILSANPAVSKISGFANSELIGKDYMTLIIADESKIHYFYECRDKKNEFSCEFNLRRKDGSICPAEISFSYFSDGLDTVKTSMIIRDISARKQAEEKLRAAKEKAEESDRLKTAFLHNISHEIRTPLNSIIGFAEFLTEDNLTPEECTENGKIIIESSHKLLSIITDIIDISRIQAGRETLRLEEINIIQILEKLKSKFSWLAIEKKIEFNINSLLSPIEFIVSSDKIKLETILDHLLDNSFKFTHTGFVELTCCRSGDNLEISVKDSGIGIPAELQQDIFQQFRTVEITDTRSYGGLGLGLSICKAFVEELGGTITVDSSPGNGSTFYIAIPSYRGMSEEKQVRVPLEPKKQKDGNKFTIVIAEDDSVNFMLLEKILSSLDAVVLHAENGLQAVDYCRKNPAIDLVLMDIKMPELDGLTATRIIKEERPDLPIIAQTAFAMDADIARAKDAGCVSVITKPFDKGDILSKIVQYLLPD